MKKIYLYLALPALLLTGCKDEDFGKGPEVDPGTDVVFDATLAGVDGKTRTIYGDFNEAGTGRKVMWVNGDVVSVFSPQCAADFQKADYKVEVKANQSFADKLVKANATGVRWGDAAAADTKFYATYPTSQLTADADGNNVLASISISETQESLLEKGTSTSGSTQTVVWRPVADQQIPDNVMYAQPISGQSQVDKQTGNVKLQFNPFSTVLHVTLDGWNLTNDELTSTVTNIVVFSAKLTAPSTNNTNYIAGNFGLNLNSNGTTPTVSMPKNTAASSNSVTVSFEQKVVNEDGTTGRLNGVSLAKGEHMEFDLFMIPNANTTITTDWTIELNTSNGTFKRSLTPGAGTNSTLVPGQIHKMELPPLSVDNDWIYNPESWLADVKDNVYFTEVCLPGSWYSASNGSDKYQDDDIATQFTKGVRAFFLETRVGSTGSAPDYSTTNPSRRMEQAKTYRNGCTVVISGTGSNQSAGDLSAYYSATSIDATLTAIATAVSKHPGEFAVLTLSYSDGGSSGVSGFWKSVWLEKINAAINANESFKSLLFTGTFNANTTVAQMRNKILLKINVDDDSEITSAYTTTGVISPADDTTTVDQTLFGTIPALFSYTNQAWDPSAENASLVSNLYWKAKPTLTGATINQTGFFWNYTMANRTYINSSPTMANRQASIRTLIAESKKLRATGKHNVFFMVGAGGTLASRQGATSAYTDGPSYVANGTTISGQEIQGLNQFLLDRINEKIATGDASPLGLVYTNFSTGEIGQQVINAIIRLNKRFTPLDTENTGDISQQDFGAFNLSGGDAY